MRAGAWVFGLMVAALASGCLLPSPIFEQDQENHPVWVDDEQISPDPRTIVLADPIDLSTGATQSFSVGTVWDDDVEDTVYLRWFVDYDENQSIRYHDFVRPRGRRERPTHAWELDFCAFSDLRRPSRERALIEAVVSDRDFLPDEDGRPPYDNRLVPDDATTQVVFWWVPLTGDCNAAAE